MDINIKENIRCGKHMQVTLDITLDDQSVVRKTYLVLAEGAAAVKHAIAKATEELTGAAPKAPAADAPVPAPEVAPVAPAAEEAPAADAPSTGSATQGTGGAA